MSAESESLGKSVLTLSANFAEFQGGLEASHATADDMTEALDALATISDVSAKALGRVKMTSGQGTESLSVAESILEGIAGISEESKNAARELGNVKMTETQAVESKVAAELISEGLDQISRNADQAKRKIEEVGAASGAAAGASDAAGLLGGLNMPGLMPSAIGVGGLLAPAAGPAVLGLLAAIPGIAAGAAGALGTLALAFDGVFSAIGGDKKAFDALQPSQQAFVESIRSLDGWFKTLKQTAAGDMFPGLTDALHSALSPGTMNAVTTAIGEFATAIGDAGKQWGTYFGSAEFQSIFGPLMQSAAKDLGVMSTAALALFDALGVLGKAAIPLTTWMTEEIANGAKFVDSWLQAKDATGQLSGALDQAKMSLQIVGNLIGSLLNAVGSLGAALYPVSQTAVKDLTTGLNDLAGIISRNQDVIREIVATALTGLVSSVKIAAEGIELFNEALTHIVGNKATVITAILLIGAAIELTLGPEAEAITGALLAVGYITDHWATVKTFFSNFGTFVKGVFSALWDGVKGITDLAIYGLLAEFDLLLKAIAGAVGHIPYIGSSVKTALDKAAGYIDQFKTNGIKDFAEMGTAWGNAWGNAFNTKLQQAVQTATKNINPDLVTSPFPGAAQAGQQSAADAAKQTSALKAYAAKMAALYNVPQALFLAQINQESGFNPTEKSSAGALGIAQFMPGTAAGLGVNPMDPKSALAGAARMDANAYAKYGSWAEVLSAYNSGNPTAYLDPSFAKGQTSNYVKSILMASGMSYDTPTASPFGSQPGFKTNTGAAAAQALATSLAGLKTKLKPLVSDINSSALGLLDPSVISTLKANAAKVGSDIAEGTKAGKSAATTALAALRTSVQEGFAQVTDDKKLRATMLTIQDDLDNHLITQQQFTSLETSLGKYNDQLTSGLLSPAARKKVEASVNTLKAQLKLDLNLDAESKQLKTSVASLNQAIQSGLFPEPMVAGAKAQAAKVGADIAEGTQAGETAAKSALKQLAATIKEGIADATAIQNFEQALTTFGTQLSTKLTEALGIPDVYASPSTLDAAEQGAENIIAALNHGLTGTALTQAKNNLAQFQKTIEDALDGMEAAVEKAKSAYESAWSQLAAAGDSAFQANVSATVSKMQSDLQTALTNMQVLVEMADGSSFTFGGDITETPAQQQLDALELAHQIQADAAAVAAANATLGTDTAGGADPATILADNQSLSDALYQQQVDALQQQATAQQTAATAQLTAAQTSYQNQQNALIQAYQDQQNLIQQAMDQQVAAIETAFEQGNIDATTAFSELTGLYSQNGIDITTLSVAIAGNIYTGVSQWTQPISDLMTNLQAQVAATEAAIANASTITGTTVTTGGDTTGDPISEHGQGGGYTIGDTGTATAALSAIAAAAAAALSTPTRPYRSGLGVYGSKPLLAAGGIVMPRPGGLDVTVGEGRYAEAILPLSSGTLGHLGGTGDIHIHGGTFIGGNKQQVARDLKPYLDRIVTVSP